VRTTETLVPTIRGKNTAKDSSPGPADHAASEDERLLLIGLRDSTFEVGAIDRVNFSSVLPFSIERRTVSWR
jgi:hypothetical protein